MSDWVTLGRIVRAQGLKGEVRVLPFGVEPGVAAQLEGKSLMLRSPDAVRRATLESQRWHRGMWIVRLEGCSTREGAESLVGCEVCLNEEDRPRLGPDEYYDDQLVGARVVDGRTGEVLGEVVAIRPSAAANLLTVVRPDGGRFLIPAVHALITDVDLSSRTLRVDLPEGLTEISAD